MSDQPFLFKGINGSHGTYLTPPLSAEEFSRLARGEPLDKDRAIDLDWLRGAGGRDYRPTNRSS
jgi:hypothetical protein